MRKFRVVLLAALLCVFFVIVLQYKDQGKPFQGSGTQENPYLLSTAEDLVKLSEIVNNGQDFKDQYFLQTCDIDLDGIAWMPIGVYDGATFFQGVYDGGGHAIDNLWVDGTYFNPGFFGKLGGMVLNLTLSGTVETNSYTGGFASHALHGEAAIINCRSDLYVFGQRAGGFVDNFAGRILNSVSTAKVSGILAEGGIASYDAYCEHNFSLRESDCFREWKDCKVLPRKELLSAETAEELNAWIVQYIDANKNFTYPLSFWEYDNGELVFSEKQYTNKSSDAKTDYVMQKLEQNRNDIFVAITAVIACAAVSIFSAIWIDQQKSRKKWQYILGFCLLVLLGTLWYIFDGFVGSVSENKKEIIEIALLCAKLMLLLHLSVAAATTIAKTKKVTSHQKQYTFLFLFGFAQAGALITLISMDGHGIASLFFQDPDDSFMDFFHSMQTLMDGDGYSGGSIYPPLCYLFFLPFTRLIPQEYFPRDDAAFLIRESIEGRMVHMLYVAICLTLVYAVLSNGLKARNTYKSLTAVLLISSGPVLFAVERGNLIIITFVLLAFFVFYYDSKNRVIQELAILAFAAAAVQKIFPALFALLIVLRKNDKQLLRIAFYGLVLFFVPFALFGGFSQIPMLFSNLFGQYQGQNTVSTLLRVNSISFERTMQSLIEVFVADAPSIPTTRILSYIIEALLLVCACFQTGWKRVLSIALAVCGMHNSCYSYMLLYLLIPLIGFLNDNRSHGIWDGLYMFMFITVFMLMPTEQINAIGQLTLWQYDQIQHPTLQIVIQSWSMFSMTILLMCDTIVNRGSDVYHSISCCESRHASKAADQTPCDVSKHR